MCIDTQFVEFVDYYIDIHSLYVQTERGSNSAINYCTATKYFLIHRRSVFLEVHTQHCAQEMLDSKDAFKMSEIKCLYI